MELIQSNKFMDNLISLRRLLPLERKEATALNLLCSMISSRSGKYPTSQAWNEACELAYSTTISNGLWGYGPNVLLETRIRYLRPLYIKDPEYTEKVEDLIDQALFHPVLTEENLEMARIMVRNRLRNQKEDPDSACLRQALDQVQPDHPISINMSGRLEEVDSITLDQIRDLWDKISHLPAQILFAGQEDDILETLRGSIEETTYLYKGDMLVNPEKFQKASSERAISQSSIVLLYTTNIRVRSEEYYTELMLNALLGQAPNSLLFEEVREKHSYCYAISSALIRFDGVLLVTAGAQRENLPHIRELVQAQIERLINQDYPDEDLEKARLFMTDRIAGQDDSQSSMLEQCFLNSYLARPMSVEQLIEKLNNVTKDQISAAAEKLRLVFDSEIVQKEGQK